MNSRATAIVAEYNPETNPVEEAKRLLASEIKIEIAVEKDAHKIVNTQYEST